MKDTSYAFLGTGNMAGAIIGAISTDNIAIYDIDKTKYDRFIGRNLVKCENISEAVAFAKYIFLSVKPQNFAELLKEIKNCGVDFTEKCFVSIGAGISTGYISDILGENTHIIRTIPNTPLLYGNGVTALCRNKNVSDDEFDDIFGVFSNCGSAFILDEGDMNRVISATSSSPAYVYLFIKSIMDGIKKQGLTLDKNVICDMVIGSAEMMKKSPLSADELIKMVTSKGGTTEKAMNVLYGNNLPDIISKAMLECTKRADELGK